MDLSPHITALRDRLRNTVPTICLERARMVTDYYSELSLDTFYTRKAKFYKYYLDNKIIFIDDLDNIVGNQASRFRACALYPDFAAEWILKDIDSFEVRTHDPVLFQTPEEKAELSEIALKWVGRSMGDVIDAQLSDDVHQIVDSGVITVGSRNFSTASHVADYETAFQLGLRGIIEKIRLKLASINVWSVETQQKKDTWENMLRAAEALIAYANRYADLAERKAIVCTNSTRKAELETIAETCRRVPEYPPRTFREGIQFVWFIHLGYLMENIGHNHGFGRFDQYMYPLWRADMDCGRITEEETVELIEEFFIKVTETFELRNSIESEAYAGYPMWNNLTIGGIDAHGKNSCNRLSWLVLEACESVQTSQPSISFRYNRKNSQDVTDKALKLTQMGLGQPAFFNDDINIPRMLANGATIKEARNYCVHGCVECVVPGKTDCRGTAGFINGLKVLELTLHNGTDPLTGKRIGITTGNLHNFNNMDDVITAFKSQMAYLIKKQVEAYSIVTGMHAQICPTLLISALTDGCIESGKTLQCGGAKYNSTSNFLTGLANLVNSLAAIEKIVYQQKLMTLEELVGYLDSNYQGSEAQHQLLLNRVPKFGNDDDYVDKYANLIVDFMVEEDEKYTDTRGAQFQLMIQSQIYNIWQGRLVGATPDGRCCGEAMADNASPMMGTDCCGPTASTRSVAKLDELIVHKGVLLNQKLDPSLVRGEKGISVLDSIISGYFIEGGQHIQLNVVDEATLRDAQVHPEKHMNLLVRVAGYSAYFVELDKIVQENIIQRTVHRDV